MCASVHKGTIRQKKCDWKQVTGDNKFRCSIASTCKVTSQSEKSWDRANQVLCPVLMNTKMASPRAIWWLLNEIEMIKPKKVALTGRSLTPAAFNYLRPLVLMVLALTAVGCASSGLSVPMYQVDSMNPLPNSRKNDEGRIEYSRTIEPYQIQAGDALGVRFFFNPNLNQDIIVQPDGAISLPLMGTRRISGMTVPEVSGMLREVYSKELRQPEVVVQLIEAAERRIYVGGEVRQPQEVRYRRGLTPLEAVLSAGGFRTTAASNKVIVIRKDEYGNAGAGVVDLKRMVLSDGTAVFLQPWDIVLVPRDGISKVNEWVNKYIKGLLLFNGTSLSYDLNNDD